AMLAPEILLGEEIEEIGARCLRPLGIVYDTAGSAAVRRAKELLVAVRANLALMLDEGQIDRAGMRVYAQRWLLEDEGYIDRVLSAAEFGHVGAVVRAHGGVGYERRSNSGRVSVADG
ncbi:MAG: hypothetical protein ACLPZR_10175, partial [Solirubrobacteraceae bacterium]